jgi:hypothetical protein
LLLGWRRVRLSAAERVDNILVPRDAEVVVRVPGGDVLAYGTTDCGTYTICFPDVAKFEFRPPRLLAGVLTTPGTTDAVVEDLFLTTVQPLFLQVVGYEALHASAIKTARGVAAFCGASGSGKSTLAYALGRRAFEPWADDVVVFDAERDDRIVSLHLPHLPRLREPTRQLFLVEEDGPLVTTRKVARRSAPLALIFVLRPDAAHAVRRLSPSEALEGLLPHGLRFTLSDAERRRRMMTHYLNLVAAVEVFELGFRRGLERLPVLVDEIEQVIGNELD